MSLNQVKYYISLFKTIISRFSFNIKNFGIKLAFFNFLGEIADFYLFRNKPFFKNLHDKQHQVIYDFLIKRYSNIIEEYRDYEEIIGNTNKKIWCMWWQGLDSAPDLIKTCIKSIEMYSGDYELILITKDNYADYVELPSEILKKLDDGILSITHLSDIIRARLLSLYGGVWVDATLFVDDYIFKEFDNMIFNSSKGKWQIFFMGGKSNKLFSFLYDFLIQYNLDYDEFLNYFLTDFIIEIAYNSFDECKKYIDDANLENSQVFYFINNLNNVYDEQEFKSLCNQFKYFKLSYKNSRNLSVYNNSNKLTYYGHFVKLAQNDLK